MGWILLLLQLLLLPAISAAIPAAAGSSVVHSGEKIISAGVQKKTGRLIVTEISSGRRKRTVIAKSNAMAKRRVLGGESVSPSTSIVVARNVPYIFFVDGKKRTLNVAYRKGSAWKVEVAVKNSKVTNSIDASLCGAKICVSYFDEKAGTLKLTEGSLGRWKTTDVVKASDRGRLSIAVTSSKVAIALPSARPGWIRVLSRRGARWREEEFSTEGGERSASLKALFTPSGELYVVSASSGEEALRHSRSIYVARKDDDGEWRVGLAVRGRAGDKLALVLGHSGNRPIVAYQRKSSRGSTELLTEVAELLPSGVWQRVQVHGEADMSGIQLSKYGGSLMLITTSNTLNIVQLARAGVPLAAAREEEYALN